MPDWKHHIRRHLAPLALPAEREMEIIEELSEHLDDRYRERLARGATEEEAVGAVLAELSAGGSLGGELKKVEEPERREPVVLGAGRETGGEKGRGSMLADLWQDLRYGWRMLFKQPASSLVIILTLAVGIGTNVAVFSVVDAVLLRPLPYPAPEELVTIQNQFLTRNLRNGGVSAADYADYRRQKHIFAEVAVIWQTNFSLTGVEPPESVHGALVTAGLFPLLGASPAIGRFFTEEEDQPGRNNVAIISESLWRRRFGADPQIIGRALRFNDESYTVIGVTRPAIDFLGPAEVYIPAAFSSQMLNPATRSSRSFVALGRLARGVSLERARAEMEVFSRSLAAQFPADYPAESGWSIRLDSLREVWVGEVKLALWVLWGAVGCLLLAVSANVANLLLARATMRSQEISIRAALGASRARLARQLLVENLLPVIIGGAAGLLLAAWGIDLLLGIAPQTFPRRREIGINASALGFTLGISLLTGLLSSLFPVLAATRANLHEQLKEGRRGLAGNRRRDRARRLLVAAEVALSLLLLIGAGLLLQSFLRLRSVDPGFDAPQALTFRVALPATRYPEQARRAAFIEQLIGRVEKLPGVEAVGATSMLPFIGTNSSGIFTIDGRETEAGVAAPHADVRTVTWGFFDALGIGLLKGRLFSASDRADTPFVAIVDEKLAKQHWPNEDPVGKRVRRGGAQSPWYTIVGVVRHVKHSRLDAESKGALYFLYSQHRAFMITIVARTSADPELLRRAAPAEVSALDKDVPVYEVMTMDERLLDSIAPQRLSAWLVLVFAGVAVLLSMIGVYGVMAHAVGERTHEIGVRLALGAQRRDVLAMILGEGLRLTIAGVVAGLSGALALTRVISNLLFGVSAVDPLTFVGVPLILTAVALVACYLPARRATRVDPMVALRQE